MAKENQGARAVLTIAGSDSGGGAGIQADLQTFAAFGLFGTSAITCVTAQNPDAVSGVRALDAEFVAEQIARVTEAFPVAAAKTGMLYSASIVAAVAGAVQAAGLRILVVDPVMVAASGAPLLQEDAVQALKDILLPRATVLTPNAHEAELLTGRKLWSEDDLREAALDLERRFGVACVVKGGHLAGDQVVDVLAEQGRVYVFRGPRVEGAHTHGAGCTFSAALTAQLALGATLANAVSAAKQFVSEAMARAVPCGAHRPLNFFWHARSSGGEAGRV